ncbi:putative nucleic acid-binding protein [Mycoplana sp. BE70]|uniref:type II toxin-antitoxin system VapC family toxin n=1 Tax=Mycoplana sp. BE70 TaxID=2817775 RepID=UPI00285A86BC|nr:PIN domain-containing protein [Mycoplana sp. BE70]MDR6757460.1 putative nucleic acid-binding protein [Mycoplana sp. BE70]
MAEVEEAKLIASELTIAECTIAPHDVIVQAAEIAAELKLKLPDAIHVATAIVAGCDAFLSNDRGIRAPAGIEIQHL